MKQDVVTLILWLVSVYATICAVAYFGNRVFILEAFCFKPGQSGNPKGRSKGSRNKLGEDFIADLQAHWEKHGADAIEKVFTGRPDIYLKVVASVIPKEASVNQQVNVSQGFLKLLEDITERGKRERIEHRQLLIDRANAVDVEPEPIEA